MWWWIFSSVIIVRLSVLLRSQRAWPLIMFCVLVFGMILGMYMTSENYVYALDHTALSRTLIPVTALSILVMGYCLGAIEKKNISENV